MISFVSYSLLEFYKTFWKLTFEYKSAGFADVYVFERYNCCMLKGLTHRYRREKLHSALSKSETI